MGTLEADSKDKNLPSTHLLGKMQIQLKPEQFAGLGSSLCSWVNLMTSPRSDYGRSDAAYYS